MLSGSVMAGGMEPRGPLQPRQSESGVMAFVGDPGRFFVHFVCETERLTTLSERLFAQLEPTRAQGGRVPAPQPGSVVASLYVDNLWYRAQVIGVQHPSKEATLCYIDYGNTEVQSWDVIRPLPDEFRKPPAVGIACALNGAKPAGQWTAEETLIFRQMFMTEHIDEPPVRFTFVVVEPGDINKVDIFDENRRNMGRRFLEKVQRLASPPPPAMRPIVSAVSPQFAPAAPGATVALRARRPTQMQSADSAVRFIDVPMETLCERRQQVVLSYVNSPTDLWVRLSGADPMSSTGANYEMTLRALNMRMQDYFGKVQHEPLPIYLEQGFPCAALYHLDSHWYRSKVVERPAGFADPVKVLFVDYGNTEEMDRSLLRLLPPDFISFAPPLAVHARLAGVAPPNWRDWPPRAAELLDTKLESSQLLAAFSQLPAGVVEVELDEITGADGNLSTWLIRNRLAAAKDAPLRASPSLPQPTVIHGAPPTASFAPRPPAPPPPPAYPTAAGRLIVNVVAPTVHGHQQQQQTAPPARPTVRSATPPPPPPPQQLWAPDSAYRHRYKPLDLKAGDDLSNVIFIVGDGPQDMWMQSETHKPDLQMVDEAVRRVVAAPPLRMSHPLAEGTACVAQFSGEDGDNEWYRAAVLVDERRGIRVRFVDFGNESTCSEGQVRLLPDDEPALYDTPRLGLHCRLSNGLRSVGGVPMHKATKERFNDLITDNATGAVMKEQDDKGIFEMQLKRKDGRFLDDALVKAGIAERPSRPDAPTVDVAAAREEPQPPRAQAEETVPTESSYSVGCLPPLSLPVSLDDYLDVTVCSVKAPNFVFVRLRDSKDKLRAIDQLIRSCSVDENQKLINPRRGELCAWKRVDTASGADWWCRALVAERTSPKACKLYLVDLGEEVMADVSSVRTLSAELCAEPAHAIRLELADIDVERQRAQLLDKDAVARIDSVRPTGGCFGAELLLESEGGEKHERLESTSAAPSRGGAVQSMVFKRSPQSEQRGGATSQGGRSGSGADNRGGRFGSGASNRGGQQQFGSGPDNRSGQQFGSGSPSRGGPFGSATGGSDQRQARFGGGGNRGRF